VPFINVYTENDTIKPTDFFLKETEVQKRYDSLLCATLNYKSKRQNKMEYVTKYFKMFLNNTNRLTPRILINNHDLINSGYYNLDIINGDKRLTINIDDLI
jgi:hypothetical protein